MAKSKKQIIESLAAVKNVGPKYAEAAYDELGIRSIDDLVKAAEKGELQKLSGIGAKKEKSILASATGAAGAKPARTPSEPGSSTKAKPSKPKSSTSSKSKSKKADAKARKPEAKKPEPKAKAKKPEAKKPEPKAEAKNDDKKSDNRPKTTSSTARPRPQSNYQPRDRKNKSSNPIVFVGKLVFKIAKKLLS